MPKISRVDASTAVGKDGSRSAGFYELVAPFHDAFEGDRTRQVDYLRSLIERHHPGGRSVLELGCGTGAMLRLLQPHYKVTGIDLSPQMLAIASSALPGVELVEADMTHFDLGRTFDVALCVYDSINHLGSFAEWEVRLRLRRGTPQRRRPLHRRHQHRSQIQ
jgi:ubiquinone/menaquinone biosynthesis C-methylase UbiE